MFPFEFPLPNQLPMSIEHKFGEIRYTIKAAVYWKNDSWEKHKVKTLIFVNSQVDLNRFNEEKVSVDREMYRK